MFVYVLQKQAGMYIFVWEATHGVLKDTGLKNQ